MLSAISKTPRKVPEMANRNRWIIFKTGKYWTVALREKRSHIHGLPYRIWFRTHTGAEALAVFNNPSLRTKIGY
jgi:hypothetical protein